MWLCEMGRLKWWTLRELSTLSTAHFSFMELHITFQLIFIHPASPFDCLSSGSLFHSIIFSCNRQLWMNVGLILSLTKTLDQLNDKLVLQLLDVEISSSYQLKVDEILMSCSKLFSLLPSGQKISVTAGLTLIRNAIN